MRFAIRHAERADLAALLALETSFTGDRLTRRGFRHLLSRANGDVWVAAHGGTLLGNAVVLYRKNTGSARLYSLVVAPAARGHGIARALVQAAETGAAARALARMRLEVRADNEAAIALYRKLGYQLAARLSPYYEDGQDALRLERLLAPRVPMRALPELAA